MLTQKDYNAILRARDRGLTIREIARSLHHSRDKVREVLHDPIPKRYTRKKGIRVSVLEQYQETITEIIRCATEDMGLCSITAADIFRFLRDSHGYNGCYAQVLRYLKAKHPLYNKGRIAIADFRKSCENNTYMNVLTVLGLVSTRSARSILKNIAELNKGDLSKSAASNMKAQMITRYLTTSGLRYSNRRETLNPWLAQLLFHNGNTESLQKIFKYEEISALRRLLVSTSLRQRKRAATIILCRKGISFRAAARILGASRDSVAKYWHDYEEHGFDKTISYKGRRRKADDVDLQKSVFALLHSPPSSHGINRTTWTMKDLQTALRSEGSPACTHVIREIMRSAGYRWRKAKTVLTSNDPEYREKLTHIKSILSSLGENDRFFSIDEFSK